MSFSDNIFLTITCYAATQTLSNGKNAHYTIKSPEWWKEKLKPYDGKYIATFQTRPERGTKIINKEELKYILEIYGTDKKQIKRLCK